LTKSDVFLQSLENELFFQANYEDNYDIFDDNETEKIQIMQRYVNYVRICRFEYMFYNIIY
jgi:hypothetical protein